MSKLRTGLVAVTASLATVMVCGTAFQTANGAEPDTTPPTGTLQSDFIIGSQLSPSNMLNEDEDRCDNNTWLNFRISWTASDASGIDDYTMWDDNDEVPDFLGWWSNSAEWPETALIGTLSDYHGDCGGGSLETRAYAVTAYDAYGNGKWIEGGTRPTVYQENGMSQYAGNHPSMFTYSGNWTTSTCNCASGGQQFTTKQLGASATFTATGKIALAMAKGPNRGQAEVFVDGVRVSTVDTRAATNTNRIVVWTRDLGVGNHTVRVRNLATSGRPRIDFDAVVFG